MKALSWKILILFAVGIGTNSFAQTLIDGTVVNANTGDPVPYAYVKKKGKNRGAITNEDGYFQLKCDSGDTLIVSFVSFRKKEVPYTYFIDHDQLKLAPAYNELATVEVFADFDFLYDVFDVARRKLRKAEVYPSKTYFSLETVERGIPIELLECYYNASIGPNGINSLSLKNGRIGMSELDGTYYASLNTTAVISDYRLMNKRENRFPGNPLQLTKNKVKRSYDLKLLAFKGGVYKIRFRPKVENGELFEANIWIDKKSEQIVQMDLEQKDLKKYPFVPIDPRHEMDSIDFNISYTFSNDNSQSLEKVEFAYELDYLNSNRTKRMKSAGVFLFFEKNAAFDLPYYSETDHRLSDYDKIVAQPYNASFWEYNEVLSPSRRVKLYKEFFERAGVLLNFDELSRHSEVFINRLLEWSESRILLDEINDEGDFQISRMRHYDYQHLNTDFYNLEAHIYLDRNTQGDSTYYLSKTLIDIEDSFYFLEYNRYTTCMINMYYDLVEIKRREMMDVLESRPWERVEVDSIYKHCQKELDFNLRNFLTAVEHGENEAEIEKFSRSIYGNLGIDNSLLIWTDYMENRITDSAEDSLMTWMHLYNYGSALLQAGAYERSLQILLQAYSLQPDDPWLLYNLGLNYLKLGKIEKGCAFLMLSKEKGEEIPKELLSECD